MFSRSSQLLVPASYWRLYDSSSAARSCSDAACVAISACSVCRLASSRRTLRLVSLRSASRSCCAASSCDSAAALWPRTAPPRPSSAASTTTLTRLSRAMPGWSRQCSACRYTVGMAAVRACATAARARSTCCSFSATSALRPSAISSTASAPGSAVSACGTGCPAATGCCVQASRSLCATSSSPAKRCSRARACASRVAARLTSAREASWPRSRRWIWSNKAWCASVLCCASCSRRWLPSTAA